MSADASPALEQLQHDLDRWGPNLADWPDLERQQAEALCNHSAQAATLLRKHIEFQQRLDRDFPVPALDIQRLDQALTARLAPSASQCVESRFRQTPAVPDAGASRVFDWVNEKLAFFRPGFPGLSAGLLLVLGFALGFNLGLGESPALANILGDDNQILAAVAQQAFEDSGTDYYQSYGEAFMQENFQTQQQELHQP